jgi:hypothetical protein
MKFLNKILNRKPEQINTRKILVPIDIKDPSRRIRDTLYLDETGVEGLEFKGIRKGKNWSFGMVILTSSLNGNMLYEEVERHNPDLSINLDLLNQYLKQVNNFKIGNIIQLQASENRFNISLVKYEERIDTNRKPIIP